jgi:hypothetical protein
MLRILILINQLQMGHSPGFRLFPFFILGNSSANLETGAVSDERYGVRV